MTDFKIVSQKAEKCVELKNIIRNTPEQMDMFEIEYVIRAQKSANREMSITGTHVKNSKLFTKLTNMNDVDGDTRYLNSKDIKKMSAEVVTTVMATLVTQG